MKGKKGGVSIDNRNGMLSLRFRDPGGRLRRVSLGLSDSRAGRGLAEVRAQLVESDLHAGTYDPTHRRYLAEKQHQYENRSVQELWDLWVATEKVQYLDAATLGTKYRATRSRLVEFFQNRSVVGMDREQVAEFVAWYRPLVSPGVLKERLTLIRACWQWALEQKYIEILEGRHRG